MRRRPATIAISLFPFLAVLLCAMGALILLLVVLTRQIREQASRQPVVRQSVVSVPEPTRPPAPPQVEVRDVPATIPRVVVKLDPPVVPSLPDPNIQLRTQLVEAEKANAAALTTTEQLRVVVADQKSAIQASQARLIAAQLALDAGRQRLAARDAENQNRRRERQELEGLLSEAQGSLKAAVAAAETAEPKVSIVPYEGRSGTPRRPILIECTGEAIRFVPEDVSLSASDLEGFHPELNPLLAGVVALYEHWREVDGRSAPRPYVLLLVHDDGIPAYYAARSMLRSIGDDMGYELVTDDLAIAFPEQDSAARDSCHAAVLDLLHSRSAALAETGRRLDKALFPTGRFEVDPRDHDPLRSAEAPFSGQRSFDRVPPSLPKSRPAGSRPSDELRLPQTASNEPLPSIPPRSTPPSLASSFAAEAARRHRTEKQLRQIETSNRLLNEATAEQWPDFRDRSNSQRGWGTSAPTASISLERPIPITIFKDRIQVGLQDEIVLGAQGISEESAFLVVEAIRSEADSWGRAPGDFYWTPKIEANIEPGGLRHFDRLKGELLGRGLRVTDRIALAPTTPNFLELDHATTAP